MIGKGRRSWSVLEGEGLSKSLRLAISPQTWRSIQPLVSVSTPMNLPLPGVGTPGMPVAVMASGSWGFRGNGVPDDLALDHVHHELSDIGGMIRNALEVLGDERQADSACNGLRVLDHEGQQFTE